jgi:hypothetical protein
VKLLAFKDEAQTALLKAQFIPHSKHFSSVIKTNQFMIQVAQVAVCSQINTKHTVWAQCTIVEY